MGGFIGLGVHSSPCSPQKKRRREFRCFNLRDEGLGFRLGGFRVEGLGFRVEGLGFRV